jgi:hypothetical protein
VSTIIHIDDCFEILFVRLGVSYVICGKNQQWKLDFVYEVCLKSKCIGFLFKCLLDSPEITSYILQSMTLGKLHNGSLFSTAHSSTGSHFP